MSLWKVKWTLTHLFDRKVFARNRNVLKSPWIFYFSLVATLLPFRVKWRFRFRLVNGSILVIHDFISCYIYWELFLYNSYKLSPRPDKPGLVIVDIGAYTGMSATLFKFYYPMAEVHCFEPYRPHFEQLRENITSSGLTRVHMYNEGIASGDRQGILHIHASNSGGHSIYPVDVSGGENEVKLIGIQTLLENTSSKTCDLMKMDCEGAEYEILKSITPDIARRIYQIVFESTYDKYDAREIVTFLESLGYRVENLDGVVYRATLPEDIRA